MPIVSRPLRCLISAVAICLAHVASAHPVAQGSLIVTISAERITMRITVSLEEVLVAYAYGPESLKSKSLGDAAEKHGAYLLKHFQVSADGHQLEGELGAAAQANSPAQSDRYVYELVYRLSAPASEFRFEENVLNEFEFAPGNRWEASYVAQIGEEGSPAAFRPALRGCNRRRAQSLP